MRKKLLIIFLALWIALSATACGAEKPQEEPNTKLPENPPPAEEPIEQPEPTPEPEPYVPAGTNPLTGEPMEPEYENDRPVAVMLNNLKAAQPQLGVSLADIIYEIPAEGGITRMLGVYQTLEGVGNLGSIRSTRSYYLEAALGHDALLVHAGGSPQAYQDIANWDIDNMDGVQGGSDAKIFWRDAERKKTKGYEHSLLTSGQNVLEYLAGGRYRTQHQAGYAYTQTFAEDGTPVNGTSAEHIKLYYSNYKTGLFDYDAGTKHYLVSQYGGPYIDGVTGEQVEVTNVLVLDTAISVIAGDTAGRLNVKMTGSGSGTYFCGGKSVPICWSKKDRNSPFTYTLEDDTPLILGQGKSYVCIIDSDTSRLEVT